MRKLGILVMAFVLVFGMSAMASASLLEEDVGVYVNVPKKATLNISGLNSNNNLVFDLDGTDKTKVAKGSWGVKTNTSVDITINSKGKVLGDGRQDMKNIKEHVTYLLDTNGDNEYFEFDVGGTHTMTNAQGANTSSDGNWKIKVEDGIINGPEAGNYSDTIVMTISG